MLQLNPPIPMIVIGGSSWKGPTGKALCHFVIDNGPEHSLIWIVFMQDTGQSWCVPNQYIRAEKNFTYGRISPDTIHNNEHQEDR